MICEYCRPWCAITRAQLDNRKKNMEDFPEVKPHQCPKCGGTEWATTEQEVKT